jgi:cell division protein FtsW (lipid II flippase)
MHVLVYYLLFVGILLIGSASYTSSYTKDDIEALTKLVTNPILLVPITLVSILYLAIKRFKKY